MKTIIITVEIWEDTENKGGVSRQYTFSSEKTPDIWGERIVDMLDTLEKSNEKEF
jgi:hypothetical protein